jgi:DNA repair protein RadC
MMIKQLPITSWNEQDRPREKAIDKGISALTDAELLALFVSTGTREKSAVELCDEILKYYDYDLNRFSTSTKEELFKFKGIGEAKAISFLASFELARRLRKDVPKKNTITSSNDAYVLLVPYLENLRIEEFYVLLLNQKNTVIRTVRISQGGIAGTLVDVRVIFKNALDVMATSIILAHNHPSGQLTPSQADKELTRKIIASGELLQIRILDHLIIGLNNYFSFADNQLI